MHEQMDSIITFHSDYWQSLKHEELLKYTDIVKSNKEKVFGIIEDESSSDESKSSED